MRQQVTAVAVMGVVLCLSGVSCSTVPRSGTGDSSEGQPRRGRRSLKRAELMGPAPWAPIEDYNWKRAPLGLGASGFHGDTFSQGFGAFSPVKRRPGAAAKRRPEMDASGFYGDTFNGGMGYFDTMKRRPEMDASGFYGDTFNGGLGYFDTMKKRRPEMDASGFYGDTFNGGLGYFDTMRKRRPEMDASGFHGDTFSGGFGMFDTMKRRVKPTAARSGKGETSPSGRPATGGPGSGAQEEQMTRGGARLDAIDELASV